MELLAPAGSLECGIAGLHYGADALYLGLPRFSARADAVNLTFEELAVLVGLAHGETPSRKVYVTLNTLLRQDEIPGVIEMLGELYDAGIDGLIVQDAALIGLVRRHFPRLPLHASTQMAIHNVEGVRQAKAMGFSRAVLARELTLPEITRICQEGGLEIEVFIHGALCYSYSGLCLLSAAINGNSGNRGSCSYVCRNRFKIQDASGKTLDACCPMSMKDLALPEMLPALEKAGVCSLKIEGRKKTPLYVAAVTNYYRKLIDGKLDGEARAAAELDVRSIFSRPWTRFFVQNPQAAGITDTRHLGPRGIDAGSVSRVRCVDAEHDRLRFVVKNRPVEKHDGLQVELPDMEKPYGFPVTELLGFTQGGQEKWTPLYRAEVGTTVEVPLPPGHPEIPAGSRLFCASSQAVRRSYVWPEPRPAAWRRRTPVDVRLVIAPDALEVVCSADGLHGKEGASVPDETPLSVTFRQDAELQPAQQPDKVEASARQAFAKLGDTEYVLRGFSCENPSCCFVPASLLNELRRKALSLLDDARVRARRSYIEAVASVCRVPRERPVREGLAARQLKVDRTFSLNLFEESDLSLLDELVFDIGLTPVGELEHAVEELSRIVPKERIRASLPALARSQGGSSGFWNRALEVLRGAGVRRFEIGNVGALALFPDMKREDVTGDWPLYTMNTAAAATWLDSGLRRLIVCPEDTDDNIMELLGQYGDRLVVPLYQATVLARSAVCIMKSIRGFCPGNANCAFKGPLTLTRADGVQLTAVSRHCTTLLLETPPRDWTGRFREFSDAGAGTVRVDCTGLDFSPAAVRDIWRRL